MSPTPAFLPRLFAEMKRRKVFRVMAVYGIVGFVVLQVVDLTVPALLLPDWTYRLIALILITGFPFAIVLAWAFEQTPEGLKRTERAGPEEIEAIVAEPPSRRWPAGLLALAGAALLFGGWWAGRQTTPATESATTDAPTEARLAALSEPAAGDERPTIAVLPFANMSGEDGRDFSNGMTDEIGNVLVNMGQLHVRGRLAAFAYREQELDLRQIGENLGVDYLVSGSVRRGGDTLRITARLINAATGEQLWSQPYDRELTIANVLRIQTEIAEAVSEALAVPLGLDDHSGLVTPTGDLEAYDLYLAGRAQMRERAGDGASLVEAIELFEAAIAHDSSFAPAWAALAEAKEISVWWRATYDHPRAGQDDAAIAARALAESERAATRALELDPRNPSAMVALASVHRDRGQWSDAEDLYLRALEIDPDNAEAHHQYGELLGHVGRIAEAVRSTDRAAVLDPAPIRLYQIGLSLELDDRPEESAAVFQLAMDLDPNVRFETNWASGYHALARLGRTEEALRAARALEARLHPDDPWPAARWDSVTNALAKTSFELVPDSFHLYWGELVAMGRPDSAVVDYLSRNWYTTAGLHEHRTIWQPEFDALRSDPRIRAYMEEVGLADAVVQRTPVAERTRPMILDRAR